MNIPIGFLNQSFGDANAMIREQIINLLHNRNLSAFRDLEVVAADGVVTLRGKISSFYHKQLALSHSKRVAGSYQLVDEIIVESATQP